MTRRKTQSSGAALTFVPAPGKSYLALFKPYGVVCQFSKLDDGEKLTLGDLGLPADVYSIGRLDHDSEGLLILSDDARLNGRLLNPAHRHERTYLAQVENVPTYAQLAKLSQGVILDGVSTLPARAELLTIEPKIPDRPVPIRVRKTIPTAWIKLTLREGKNRQVRRMTASVGCPTLRLLRIAIGRLDLFALALQPGEWTRLNDDQVHRLFEPSEKTLRIPAMSEQSSHNVSDL